VSKTLGCVLFLTKANVKTTALIDVVRASPTSYNVCFYQRYLVELTVSTTRKCRRCGDKKITEEFIKLVVSLLCGS
jgi:hypothetical protein